LVGLVAAAFLAGAALTSVFLVAFLAVSVLVLMVLSFLAEMVLLEVAAFLATVVGLAFGLACGLACGLAFGLAFGFALVAGFCAASFSCEVTSVSVCSVILLFLLALSALWLRTTARAASLFDSVGVSFLSQVPFLGFLLLP